MEVDMVYVDGIDSLVAQRTTTRKWYLTDNTTVGVSTVSLKKYTNSQGVTEGIRRRQTNINELKLAVPGLIIATEGDDLDTARDKGRLFFSELENQFSSYIAVDDRTLITDIAAIDETVNHTWLDNIIAPGVTIELYIQDQIDY